MNVARDVETERVIAESKRIRESLGDLMFDLDQYVTALQGHLERIQHHPTPEAKEEP